MHDAAIVSLIPSSYILVPAASVSVDHCLVFIVMAESYYDSCAGTRKQDDENIILLIICV